MSRRREDKALAELLTRIHEDESGGLCDDHLPFLFRALHDLSARWYAFSVQLGVTDQDKIQRNGRAVDECFALALMEWLQSGDASWKSLVEAVFTPSGGAHQVLARRITDSYRGLCCFKPSGFSIDVSTESVIAHSGQNTGRILAYIKQLLGNRVASRWYQMGVVMGVPVTDLEGVRVSPEYQSVTERETAMLKLWIEGEPHLPKTWQVLVDSVEHRAGGGYRGLAKEMSKKIPVFLLEISSEVLSVSSTDPSQPQAVAADPLDRKPTLKQLTMMKNKAGEQIEVLKSVAPAWRIVGALFDFDAGGTQLALIESKNGQQNPIGCCEAMLLHWLAGNGEQPATWRKLIEILRDSEKDWLAEQLQQTLCED